MADASATYDCPKCQGVQTVVDAGDGQWVYWCKSCKGFFSELDLKKILDAEDAAVLKPAPDSTGNEMDEIEFTWARFAKMAWLFCWRLVALSFFLGVAAFDLLSWALKAITGRAGPPGISAIVLIPIVILCLRMMLRKHYQDFRIALVSTRRPTAHLDCRIPDKADIK